MFRFSIDRGGTFTDVYAECPSGEIKVLKLLSEDPANYCDAPREAIRRIMEEVRIFQGRTSKLLKTWEVCYATRFKCTANVGIAIDIAR